MAQSIEDIERAILAALDTAIAFLERPEIDKKLRCTKAKREELLLPGRIVSGAHPFDDVRLGLFNIAGLALAESCFKLCGREQFLVEWKRWLAGTLDRDMDTAREFLDVFRIIRREIARYGIVIADDGGRHGLPDTFGNPLLQ